MGEPTRGNARVPHAEYIGVWGARRELKHLSTSRKRDYSPSSGERTGKSLNSARAKACRRCALGVASPDGASTQAQRSYKLNI